jgi:hypothetical protein
MLSTSKPTPGNRIESYIRAKDGNRPALALRAFANNATVSMDVKTSAIAFPATLVGASAIAEELVTKFGEKYENIYTFCMGNPPADSSWDDFRCDWCVCMTDKRTRATRLGCGEYVWRFEPNGERKILGLGISIESMLEIVGRQGDRVIEWADSVNYPWCPAGETTSQLRELYGLNAVTDFLSSSR